MIDRSTIDSLTDSSAAIQIPRPRNLSTIYRRTPGIYRQSSALVTNHQRIINPCVAIIKSAAWQSVDQDRTATEKLHWSDQGQSRPQRRLRGEMESTDNRPTKLKNRPMPQNSSAGPVDAQLSDHRPMVCRNRLTPGPAAAAESTDNLPIFCGNLPMHFGRHGPETSIRQRPRSRLHCASESSDNRPTVRRNRQICGRRDERQFSVESRLSSDNRPTVRRKRPIPATLETA